MKSILLVSQYFWPEVFKGNDIAVDFVRRGYQVTVLTGKPNYPQGKFYPGYAFWGIDKEVYEGAQVIRVPLIPRGQNGLTLILNYLSFVFFGSIYALFLARRSFDIILVQQLSPVTIALPAILIKKLKKIPLVLWVLDLWPESITATTGLKNRHILRLLKELVRFIYKSSDKILVSSNNFSKSILNIVPSRAQDIHYFPNWAESFYSEDSQVPTTFRVPDKPGFFNIIYAGNLGAAQDFESVLKAVAETESRPINWILVGDGRKREWIEREIAKRKLKNIYLTGSFPLEQMPAVFAQADAMLVSLNNSPAFELTVPAKVQAYLCSGKVILGMLNGEGAQIINKSGAGIAVAAGQSHLLAEAAKKLAQMDPSSLNRMKTNAKKYYSNHFEQSKLFDFLEDLIIGCSQ